MSSTPPRPDDEEIDPNQKSEKDTPGGTPQPPRTPAASTANSPPSLRTSQTPRPHASTLIHGRLVDSPSQGSPRRPHRVEMVTPQFLLW